MGQPMDHLMDHMRNRMMDHMRNRMTDHMTDQRSHTEFLSSA